MNYTEPIKSREVVQKLLRVAKSTDKRTYMMLRLQLAGALRISDVLQLRVQDWDARTITLTEQKTGKKKTFELSQKLADEVAEYVAEHNIIEYILPSRKGGAISRVQAYRLYQRLGNLLGISLSTHTIRKTTAYHLYERTNDISLVMKLLNHSSEAVTLRYLGIADKHVYSVVQDLF